MSTAQNKNFSGAHYVDLLAGKKKYGEKSDSFKGSKRVLKLLILCFLLPLLLLIYPLYLRNRVYIQEIYPIGVSDMRRIDNKISTTWCQRQLINSNTTFNAYVIANEPQISRKIEKIDMPRSMVLKDGAKEYWGFYLLKGSSFKVSACVRWPGATLIIIEGHKNLKECAYVGDNSSEETDNSVSSEEDSNVTVFHHMTKIAPGIKLNYDWKLGKNIQVNVSEKSEELVRLGLIKPEEKTKNVHLRYAEDLYAKDRKNSSEDALLSLTRNEVASNSNSDAKVLADILNRLNSLGPSGRTILQKLHNQTTQGSDMSGERLHQLDLIIEEILEGKGRAKSKKRNKNDSHSIGESEQFNTIRKEILMHRMKLDTDNEVNTAEEVIDDADKAEVHISVKHTKNKDHSKSEYWSSFSSSEERLLVCKGLLVSLPLIPYQKCDLKHDNKQLDAASDINSVSYKIQTDGYYFFIFNNENEVEQNFIYAHFQINKTVYDTSEAVTACRNQSKKCSLPLTFWSKERTILELPNPIDDAMWNEEFIFITQCEPRSILYIVCIVSVFVGVLLFAFT